MLGSFERPVPPRARLRQGLAALALTCGLAAVAVGSAAAAGAPVESAAGAPLPANGYTYDNARFDASSCVPSGTCVFVGQYKPDSGNDQGLILVSQDGLPAAGGAVETTVTGDNLNSGLVAVSCWSSTQCVAVGYYVDTSGDQQALVVPLTNGVPGTAQKIQPPQSPSPNPVNAHPVASLRGVSCLPSGSCFAVGMYHDTTGGYDAFEVPITNGTAGTAVEVAAPANTATQQYGFLGDITCQPSGSCVAVGDYYYDPANNSYAMVVPITNGVVGAASALTAAPVNTDPVQDGWLSNVACPATGTCSAIGGYVDSAGYDRTMVVPITAGVAGQASDVTPPSDSSDTQISDLEGLSCQSTGDCVAVGNYTTSTSTAAVAVTMQNGSSGVAHEVALPNDASTTSPNARLWGVGCPASGACIAVGLYGDGGGVTHAITVAIDGSSAGSAAVAPTPSDLSSSQPYAGLRTVGCATASCAAAGNYIRQSDNTDNPYVLSVQAPLTITPTTLPAGKVDSAYSQTLSVTGAWGAYGTWSVASGSLPAGLALNSQTGVISGTPTAGGTSNFTVQVAATSGTPLQTATQSYSVSIAALPTTTTTTTTTATPVLSLAGHAAVVSKNKAGVELACSAAPCNGAVKLQITQTVTVKHGKKKVRKHVTVAIGNAGFSLAAGETESIKVTINAVGRRAVAARHRLSATVLDTLGGSKGTLGQVTLTAAPTKHKKKH